MLGSFFFGIIFGIIALVFFWIIYLGCIELIYKIRDIFKDNRLP